MGDAPEPRRILFVCTANICRSPTAELLARSRFGEGSHLFRSAGLMEGGREVPSDLQSVLGQRDVASAAHRSNQIDSETLAAAELILTMEGKHVQEIGIQEPEALPKVIPLKEAAERLSVPATVDGFVQGLQSRDVTRYLSSRWDVDDPYKRGKRRYRKMVDEVEELVSTVIGNLR